MTEGNIARWRVRDGDSFIAGDVLLEIETDKATMDVEAQEDGIMAKIIQADGTKGVQVGTRIAVLAELGDDVSSLEIPDESEPAPKTGSGEKESKQEGSQASEAAPPPKSTDTSKSVSSKPPSGTGQNTKYPLYPAVTALIHEHHISESEISQIPASGPNGRLLKGDVLSYLGRIQADYSSTQSKRIQHLTHMDLSNIKIAAQPETQAESKSEAPIPTTPPGPPSTTSISLPISLSEVLIVQKRIQDSLGVSIPLSTYLARAVDMANDDLPQPKGATPSPNDLFNAILGLDSLPSTSRGGYIPQINALPSGAASVAKNATAPTSRAAKAKAGTKAPDIIDILSGRAAVPLARNTASETKVGIAATAEAMNVFSVTVPIGEEKRAKIFLERVKTVLQIEPGRLVL